MIKTNNELKDFLHKIEAEKTLAIDTEFKRVNSYYPQLCLLQIACDSATDCIDVLADINLEPLFDKLYDEQTLWVVHSARQDIEALYCLCSCLPKQIFDTQIAAGLVNYPMQVSYQALTESLQGVYLEKAYTRFDWTTRPLPDEAVQYALDDVKYLLQNHRLLTKALEQQSKIHWQTEESNTLLNESLYKPPISESWRRLKGFSRLSKKAQLFAAQLASWREYQAIKTNKPRRWVMSDDKLFAYATGKQKLSKLATTKFRDFVSKQPNLDTQDFSQKKHTPPTKAEKHQKQMLQKLIQDKANQYNLSAEMLANSKSILRYIRGDHTVGFCKGWRFELLREDLNAK